MTNRSRLILFFAAAVAGGGAVYLWGGAPSIQDAGDLKERLEDAAPGDRWIYDDWEEARRRAVERGKPIFALFRCVP